MPTGASWRIAAGGVVIPGGTAPVLLAAGKEVLDSMAPRAGFPVVGPLLFAVGLVQPTLPRGWEVSRCWGVAEALHDPGEADSGEGLVVPGVSPCSKASGIWTKPSVTGGRVKASSVLHGSRRAVLPRVFG